MATTDLKLDNQTKFTFQFTMKIKSFGQVLSLEELGAQEIHWNVMLLIVEVKLASQVEDSINLLLKQSSLSKETTMITMTLKQLMVWAFHMKWDRQMFQLQTLLAIHISAETQEVVILSLLSQLAPGI